MLTVTTTCPACDRAATNARTGVYQSGCMPCEARALAQSPEAKQRDRDPSALQRAMRAVWTNEADYRKGRVMVWHWINEFEEGKA